MTEQCAPGVYRIAVPTPWMGTVNAYLLQGDPLTLLDSGPGITASTALLRDAVRELGHELAEIELLIASHQHFDHMGAMQAIAEDSGAEVICLQAAVPFVESFAAAREDEDDWLHGLMLRHGVSRSTARAARQFARLEAHLAQSLVVTRPVRDGELLRAGGRDLRVLHRPGHSPSDIILHDERDGLIFAGDHLLAAVSSNALLSLPLVNLAAPVAAGWRPHALLQYRDSLRATRELSAQRVLPGHGELIDDHVPLINARLAEQERRAGKLRDALRDGPRTAFALAESIWKSEASAQVFLVLSEVLGHLDLVLGDGVVERIGEDESTFAHAASAAS